MASNVFSQNFATQAPFGDLTLADNTVAGGLLSFQDFPASQDHYYEFNDFSQLQGINTGFADGIAAGVEQLRFDDGFDEASSTHTPEQLPEWACAYCGVHNPSCVVKCIYSGKWFCNGRMGSSGSCIVVHLVKSKCREVQLHRDSPLGEAVLECYASGNKNVFSLGFVPVAGDNTVVLLARDTPPNHPSTRDLGVDMSQWQPIIEDRQFVAWMVKVPSEEERLRSRRLTPQQVTALEELWKAAPEARLEDLEGGPEEPENQLTPAVLRYEDAAQYQAVFRPLVKLEADYDKASKEAQRRENITVRWDVGLNKKKLACFFTPQDDVEVKLMMGDELRLKHRCPSGRPAWEGTGHVIITGGSSEEVCLEMAKPEVPEDTSVGFSLEFVWKATSFERMSGALKLFKDYSASISGYLFHILLGHEVEPITLRIPLPKASFSAPNLPELNHSQLHAVRSVLQQPLSLIQGPPGTGKTVTSATIVYHLCTTAGSQVLVCAPSNVGVDQLAEKVAATGLKVVRLCAKSREAVASPVEHLTLHHQVAHLNLPGSELFRKLRQLKSEKGGLTSQDERHFAQLRRSLEAEVLAHADVVCATCVGAGDARLAALRFQHVLVDECTQASEPEALIPLVLGAKQVILVGDHCQLPPVIMCKRAAEAGLCQSLFERLRLLGVKPIRLQVQYRMHPCLSEFPSNTFYEGTLQNGAGAGDRRGGAPAFPWPKPDKPMMFWVQLGAEEISASGTSYLNRTEAANVEKLLTRFLQAGVLPAQLGVITPYEGQRANIVATLLRHGPLRQDLYKAVEVSSVDAFQGREKDYIIVSCVRSNEQSGIGFLADPRRMNVALTRARYGLILLGNPRVLSRQPLWNALLSHFKEHELLVEGPLTNLKPSMIALSQPKRKFDRAAFGVGGVGAGGMGAIGRYHPPERVGDPIPGSLAAAAAAAAAGAGAGSAAAAAMNGPSGMMPAGPAAAAAGGFRAMDGPGYSPFAGPSYAIPAAGGFDSSRPGRLSSSISGRPQSSSSSSQLGLNTQPDFGLGAPGSSQSSFGVGGLGGYGDGVLGTGLSGLLNSQPGLMSQAGAMSQAGGSSGAVANGAAAAGVSVNLPGLGLSGFPDTQGLSQASFGFGAGADDPYGASLGLGGAGMDASGVLSQAGFDQSQIGDILGAPSTQPAVGNKFGG